ncbi:MAG TPA: hypothetical protein VGN57_15950 [Pirellulaceae bacterium]|jgi:hypothetical protein|nr:hypothetical protein [Pirellulaceae bacterium]
MLARWTLRFVVLAGLLVGTGVVGTQVIGDDGPAGGRASGNAAGANVSVPTGGQQPFLDQVAVDPATGKYERLREGTTLRLKGRFDLVGERATFYTEDGSASFKTLENLALQRVVGAVRDSTASRVWNVEATVTEFQGGNFLLIRRATVTLGE